MAWTGGLVNRACVDFWVFFFISKIRHERHLTIAELEERSLAINLMDDESLRALLQEQTEPEIPKVAEMAPVIELETPDEPEEIEEIAQEPEDAEDVEPESEIEEVPLVEPAPLKPKLELEKMRFSEEPDPGENLEPPAKTAEPEDPLVWEPLLADDVPLPEPEMTPEFPFEETIEPEFEELPEPELTELPEIEAPEISLEQEITSMFDEPELAPEEIIDTPIIEVPEVEIAEEVVQEAEPEASANEKSDEIVAEQVVLAKPKIDREAEKKKTRQKTNKLLQSLNFDLSKKLEGTETKTKSVPKKDWKGIKSASSVIASNKKLFSKTKLAGRWRKQDLSDVQLRKYMPVVNETIKPYWHVPVSLDPTLQVFVKILVAVNGRILSVEQIETSGSKIFDEAVENVFAEVSHLPALPEEFSGEYTEIGLNFHSSL